MNLSGPGLRLILEFRRGHYPPTHVPLRLPPLAHDLAREVQHILRFIVQRERVNFPPLRLPSVKMVEIKARAWSRTVYNFRAFLRSWVPGKPTGVHMLDMVGHLFAPVRQILPFSSLADHNLNDTTSLSDKQWTCIAEKELHMWCNRWRLPGRVRSGLLQRVQHQLTLHHRALQSDSHQLHREVKHDLQVLRGLVFTPADHFPHSFHVACPFAFHALLDTNFLDATAFQRCTVGMSYIIMNLKRRFQSFPKWTQRYSWGCNGLLPCQWLASCRNPARVSRRPDLTLLVITAGIHG